MDTNQSFIAAQPEEENRYGLSLSENEKILFQAKMDMYGDEQDKLLGLPTKSRDLVFVLTSQNMIIKNGEIYWIVNIEKDIASFQKVKGRLFSKGYFSVELTDWAYYGSNPDKPEARLRGLHLYFKNREIARLEAMIENVFQ